MLAGVTQGEVRWRAGPRRALTSRGVVQDRSARDELRTRAAHAVKDAQVVGTGRKHDVLLSLLPSFPPFPILVLELEDPRERFDALPGVLCSDARVQPEPGLAWWRASERLLREDLCPAEERALLG